MTRLGQILTGVLWVLGLWLYQLLEYPVHFWFDPANPFRWVNIGACVLLALALAFLVTRIVKRLR